MVKVVVPVKRSPDQVSADFFLALANKSRLKIVDFLKDNPGSAVSVIAQNAEVSPQRISDHLGVLRRQEIITAQKEGRSVFYTYNQQGVHTFCADFLDWLEIDKKLKLDTNKKLENNVLVNILRLFASDGRCSILYQLKNEMLSINDIQTKVFLEQQTVSDHLQLLRKVKFVVAYKEGRFVKCQMNKPAISVFFKIFLSKF